MLCYDEFFGRKSFDQPGLKNFVVVSNRACQVLSVTSKLQQNSYKNVSRAFRLAENVTVNRNESFKIFRKTYISISKEHTTIATVRFKKRHSNNCRTTVANSGITLISHRCRCHHRLCLNPTGHSLVVVPQRYHHPHHRLQGALDP